MATGLAQILGGQTPDVVKCNAEGAEFAFVDQLAETGIRPGFIVLAVHTDFGDVESLRSSLEAMEYEVSDSISGHHPVWHCRLRPSV